MSMVTLFRKEIPFDEMKEEDKAFIWDKFVNAQKNLKEYTLDQAKSMIYVIVDNEKKIDTYLSYHKEVMSDPRLRFIAPEYQMEVLERINEY